MTFLRQSIRSSYCAVYSTGMLLSIYGRPTSKKEALTLFGLKPTNPGYEGTHDWKTLAVLRKTRVFRKLHWKQMESFRPSIARHALQMPTLLSYGVQFSAKHNKEKSLHLVILTEVIGNEFRVLDPLGRPTDSYNVSFTLDGRKIVDVDGYDYRVDPKMPARILVINP